MKVETLKTDSELVQNHEEICCAICIDNFEAGSVVRHLTCTHVYHKKCIDPWLVDKGTCPQCKADILKSLGLGEAIQQPSPVAESSITGNDEENPLETPPSGETADASAQVEVDSSGETESPDGDVRESNVENNIENISELSSPSSGQSNDAFEHEENVVIENENNAVVVKQTRKEDRPSDILPGMQTPDEEESQDKTTTGFSAGDDSAIETEQTARNEGSNSNQKSTF